MKYIKILNAEINKNSNTKIIMSDLFKDQCKDNVLYLSGIPFYLLGHEAFHIDFSNCILTKCDFSFMDCRQFIFDENYFETVQKDNKFRGSILNCNLIEEPRKEFPFSFFDSIECAKLNQVDGWYEYMCQHNPEEVMKYESLSSLSKHNTKFERGNDYFFELCSKYSEKKVALGWKLHISVNKNYLAIAYDLALPILLKYVNAFKVRKINSFRDRGSRTEDGAQITIYLEELDPSNNREIISIEKVKLLINEITLSYIKNNIEIGVLPISDAKTISPYFTIRNDRLIIPVGLMEYSIKHKIPRICTREEYVSAEIAGRNYNPGNFFNPFLDILDSRELRDFNVNTHFRRMLSENNSEDLLLIINILMLAYINEHTVLLEMKGFSLEKNWAEYCVTNDIEHLRFFIRTDSANNNTLETVATVINHLNNKKGDILDYLSFVKLLSDFQKNSGLDQDLQLIVNEYLVKHESDKFDYFYSSDEDYYDLTISPL